jgi:hypothetical protein
MEDRRPPVLVKNKIIFMYNGIRTVARCYAREDKHMLVVVKGVQKPIRISCKEVISYIKPKNIRQID